jgi:hypothetical protein
MIRNGTVALSPFQNWIPMNMEMRMPKMTKSRMMRQLDQGYLEPPHWRASRRQIMPGMKTIVP